MAAMGVIKGLWRLPAGIGLAPILAGLVILSLVWLGIRLNRSTLTLSDVQRTVFKLNCAIVFSVLCLAMVEGGAYVLFRTMSGETSRRSALERAMIAADLEGDLPTKHRANVCRFRHELRYQPYSLWTHIPQHASTLNVDEAWGGIRRTIQQETGAASEAVDVYMFGGSTMFCLNSPDGQTLASEVAAALRRQMPGRRFRVVNFGVSGYLNDQEVVRLTQVLTEGGKPGLVIFYDGVNDKLNKVVQDIPHFEFERFRAVETATPEPPARRVFEGLLSYDYIHRVGGILFEADPPSRYRDYSTDCAVLRPRAEEMARRYRQNVEFAGRLGAASGFEVVWFWQPDLLNTGKRLTDEEQALLEEAPGALLREGFRLGDEAVVCELEGVTGFYDVRDALDAMEASVFYDFCHVSAPANRVIARAMVDRLVEGGHVGWKERSRGNDE